MKKYEGKNNIKRDKREKKRKNEKVREKKISDKNG